MLSYVSMFHSVLYYYDTVFSSPTVIHNIDIEITCNNKAKADTSAVLYTSVITPYSAMMNLKVV